MVQARLARCPGRRLAAISLNSHGGSLAHRRGRRLANPRLGCKTSSGSTPLLSNAASQRAPPASGTKYRRPGDAVVWVQVAAGINKPYVDLQGRVTGEKRRVPTNNHVTMRKSGSCFQQSSLIHATEVPRWAHHGKRKRWTLGFTVRQPPLPAQPASINGHWTAKTSA